MKLILLLKFIKNARWHCLGKCTICGKSSLFLCLYDPAEARNQMSCIFCHSSSRKRHVAKIIKDIFCLSGPFKNITTAGISIYNTENEDIFSRYLAEYEDYYCSSYWPDVLPGTEIRPNVSCQDLQHLSFPDEKFDLVITEDVLEHVRDDGAAFMEIYRVLKPGGRHVFTIPLILDRPTIIRIDISTGKDVMLLPPEYHGDPIRGQILAYRTYGIDLFAKLEKVGFSTSMFISRYEDLRYGIVDSYVFVSTK